MQENKNNTTDDSAQRRENMLLNLVFNILVPSVMLIRGRKIAEWLGFVPEGLDVWLFVIALAFPFFYGIYDLVSRKKWNVISIIGVASVFLTGGIGLMKLSRECMIVKETAVPLIIGAVVLATAFTKKPLAKVLMLNDSVMDVKKIDAALERTGNRGAFELALKRATYIVAISFLLSALLNFLLAAYIFQSPTGTPEFNAEVGRMTALSFPVIVLPTMIIFILALVRLFKAVKSLTGLSIEDVMFDSSKGENKAK